MSKKLVPTIVAFGLIFLLSFTLIGDSNQKLTYADGYQDGKKAAKVDVKNDSNPFFGSAKYLTLPAHRLEQIQNKPSSYQRGFKRGYKESARQVLTTSPKWWSGLIIGIAVFSLAFAAVVTVGS